jgi:soluble lytic murein transglycosylase
MPKSLLFAVVVYLSGPECGGTGPSGPVRSGGGDAAPAASRDGSGSSGEAAADDAGGSEAEAAVPEAGDTLVPPADPAERIRRARAAERDGRWADAQAAYAAERFDSPIVEAAVRVREMEAAARAGDPETAGRLGAAIAAAGGPHATLGAVRAADAAYAAGRWVEALQRYRALPARLPRGADRVEAAFRAGRCLEETGRPDEAVESYTRLVREEPDHPRSTGAEDHLARLRPGFEIPPAWRLERARILTRRREWARAVEEIDRIPENAPGVSREDVLWERAQAIYKHRRRYDEAAEAYAAVTALGGRRAEEAEFQRARSLARAHRDDEAILAYRAFARAHPRSADVSDAKYLASCLEIYLGRFDDAVRSLEAVVGRRRTGPARPQSRWSLALAYLLAGRPADAIELIDGTAADGTDALTRGRAVYWGAVARLEAGRTDDAVERFREVIRSWPLHWYAQLARRRLADLGREVPPPYPERTAGRGGETGCDGLPDDVDFLRRAGLTDEARRLFLETSGERIVPAVGDELRALVRKAICVDGVSSLHRHVVSAHADDWGLRLDATALPFWEAAYPRAWPDAVEAASAREGIDPHLVWAIMRQESSFDPDVVSSADALGLLQMIPPTTQRILQARGEPYDDRVLFDPDRNIELGVYYIAWILRKFHGQEPLTSGGYNGGPHNVARWLADFDEPRLDYFVERIPFDQTRNYVRRVMTAYARYLYLYAQDGNDWPLDLPMTLRTDFLADPDF